MCILFFFMYILCLIEVFLQSSILKTVISSCFISKKIPVLLFMIEKIEGKQGYIPIYDT